MAISFDVRATDGSARVGHLTTPHGAIDTPVFMPVGTRAALRAMTPAQVVEAGAQIVLANTYHLNLQPGSELVAKFGGVHSFMGMPLPMLTDSGGFQVFSLPGREVTEEGVRFAFKKGGKRVFLNPERAVQVQQELGADIFMAFDECAPYPCDHAYAASAVGRTTRWAKRCLAAWTNRDTQALFGIVQGSTYEDLRARSAQELVPLDFPGYAIGGLSVGEGLEVMDRVLSYTVHHLPENKPRYLMGVGLPEDLLCGIGYGIDMFDCVVPTRHARGGVAYTFQGRMRVTKARYRRDRYPLDSSCTCYACSNFSRGYIHHLFEAGEILATTLLAIHNIHFLQQLMAQARAAIAAQRYQSFKDDFFYRYYERNGGKRWEQGPVVGHELLTEEEKKGEREDRYRPERDRGRNRNRNRPSGGRGANSTRRRK